MKKNTLPDSFWALNGCAPETVRLFQQSGEILICPKGCLCLRAREENTRIYFLLEGKVQIYNLTKCGKKKILFVLGKNSIANESLVGSWNTIFCETMEPCRFYMISRESLLTLMEQDFALTRTLFLYQERKLWRLEHQLKNTMGSIYLERKLASKLWKLARDFGITTEQGILIDMPLSITFLADLLGAPRETTSRVCRKLSDYGLIRMSRKQIWIPDPEKMAFFYKNSSLKNFPDFSPIP